MQSNARQIEIAACLALLPTCTIMQCVCAFFALISARYYCAYVHLSHIVASIPPMYVRMHDISLFICGVGVEPSSDVGNLVWVLKSICCGCAAACRY